ncbi:MAG: cation:proton antiporter domain-containing protein [Planctomycetota bacterium]|jgi:Kef-type K+ transport system membrane component KefB/mannitol/fructose-specific phosphotransferase system IIA component (Ntr-type)
MDSDNPLLLLSVILSAGVLVGALARRFHLPAVTGQILVGILLGPTFHVFSHESVAALAPFTHFALGLMAVEVGSHLVIARLRNAVKRLSLLVFLEATFTPLVVFAGIISVPGTSWPLAVLLATIAISTAPATILALVKETHSKGVFVKTLIAAVAFNNIACICLFELAHTAAGVALNPDVELTTGALILAPFKQFLFSLLLGGGIGVGLVLATRDVVRSDRLTTASLIAILLTVGLADYLGISALLSCLMFGVVLANLTPDKEEIGHSVFENFDKAIFAVFFTMAGMELDFGYVVPGGLLALVMFGTRFIGKTVSAYTAMHWARATNRMRRFLGLALIPQAGLAVGLMLLVTDDPAFAEIRDLFLAVVLTVVLISELVGPILTRIALRYSGDFGKDRARVIDFLHEENIITDLDAPTKEAAIERLTDLLIVSNHLKVDREELLSSILEREALGSTCVGEGVAIPHGVLPEGDTIVGAMGISREGLLFSTPDGIPIHCMLLLVTPPGARTRHLEVLAAVARAAGSDRSIQMQLFHARSPAHAYELLHVEEESEDFNYFLED